VKRVAIVLIIMFTFLIIQGQVFAQEDEEDEEGKKYAVNLSLWYPVSINKTKHDTVNLNLTLLYGRVGYVYGLDLSLIGSAISHDLEGVQICGLAGVVGETGRGLQLSLLTNIVGESFNGIQTTGLINIVGNHISGIQLAGLMNIAGESASAAQASSLFNITGENFKRCTSRNRQCCRQYLESPARARELHQRREHGYSFRAGEHRTKWKSQRDCLGRKPCGCDRGSQVPDRPPVLFAHIGCWEFQRQHQRIPDIWISLWHDFSCRTLDIKS